MVDSTRLWWSDGTTAATSYSGMYAEVWHTAPVQIDNVPNNIITYSLPDERCEYCGRMNKDNSEVCNGCGAPL